MSMIDHILLLDHIHQSINNRRTGPPKDFAARLNISESTLYRIIADLKDLGAEISYSSARRTYYYENEVEIKFSLKIKGIDESAIKGGKVCEYNASHSNLRIRLLNLSQKNSQSCTYESSSPLL